MNKPNKKAGHSHL